MQSFKHKLNTTRQHCSTCIGSNNLRNYITQCRDVVEHGAVGNRFNIFAGMNALDYSGYPDCRPEYLAAFEAMANLATAAAVEGKGRYQIHTPILNKTKADIIRAVAICF